MRAEISHPWRDSSRRVPQSLRQREFQPRKTRVPLVSRRNPCAKAAVSHSPSCANSLPGPAATIPWSTESPLTLSESLPVLTCRTNPLVLSAARRARCIAGSSCRRRSLHSAGCGVAAPGQNLPSSMLLNVKDFKALMKPVPEASRDGATGIGLARIRLCGRVRIVW